MQIPRHNNMHFIRLYLALSVLVAHYNVVFDKNLTWATSSSVAVGAFFVLSGFLIYSSYCRGGSLKKYAEKRARRILPSYLTVVMVCAVLLCLVSERPVVHYFLSSDWAKYLAGNLTFLNFLHPTLPGVFEHNALPTVNASLWTIKVELLCYALLPLLVVAYRKIKLHPVIFFGIVYLLAVGFRAWMLHLYSTTGQELYNILSRQTLSQLAYFGLGMLMFEMLDHVLRYKHLLLALGILLALAWIAVPATANYLRPLSVALVVIPVSFMGSWGSILGDTDISYDVYLWHFPVLQLIAHSGVHHHIGTYTTLALALAAVGLLSWVTWTYIGKPMLKRGVSR